MGGYDRLAVARIFFFPALGGLLFGYDIGATSYVLTQLQSAKFSGVSWYDLVARSSALQGLVTSGGVGGAFVGASVVFKVADDLGRRRELLLGAALYVLGAACEFLGGGVGPYESGAGDGLFLLVLGRFVYGVGCGFVMHGAPSYIAEMSPAAIRGTLVSLKEAAIVVGICLGYGLGFALRETAGGWRYTYAASIPLALLLYWGAYCLPPSARWLSLKGDAAGARASLTFVYPNDDALLEAAVAELDDGGGGGDDDSVVVTKEASLQQPSLASTYANLDLSQPSLGESSPSSVYGFYATVDRLGGSRASSSSSSSSSRSTPRRRRRGGPRSHEADLDWRSVFAEWDEPDFPLTWGGSSARKTPRQILTQGDQLCGNQIFNPTSM